jgi:hypothetical protein
MAVPILAFIFICGNLFQAFLCHKSGDIQAPPSDTAVGVLKILDPPGSHLLSANSVLIPDSVSRHKPQRVNRQAPQENDLTENSLFGGETLPKLINIQAECINPQFIRVSLDFDKHFQGVIYTKGHFSDDVCSFAKEDNPGTTYNFTVSTDQCGSLDNHAEVNASITEATIIVQNDPLFQDANDVARRIRCAWSDRFDKIISSHGFKVGSLAENTMDYSADAVSVWMDLRMGKDPFQGTPVTNGVVRLGSDMTIVVYIKSKIDKGLDVVIRDCVANDAKRHQQIQLTDENGCVVQKKLMTPFIITDRVGQSGASRIAYAMLKSFKFPDSLDVNIICNVAMCRGDCGISCAAERPRNGTVLNNLAASMAKVDSSEHRSKRNAGKVDDVSGLDKQEGQISDEKPGHSSREANVVPVDTHPSNNNNLPPREAAPMDDTLIGKTVFLKEKEPTEVVLERGIRVLSDNDITEVLVGNQNRSYEVMATTVKNSDYICLTRTGFGIGLGILLLIILILTIIAVFLCCSACARRKKDVKVVENSTINLYNSTDQLARPPNSPRIPSQTVTTTGSIPNMSSYPASNATGSHLGFIPRATRDPNMKASAITLPGVGLGPGLGIHTNPMIRHSTQSLNTAHNFIPSDKPFLPVAFPLTGAQDNQGEMDAEKARSLRSINVRTRPHSVAIALDSPVQDETTRSLRSFTVRSHHGATMPERGINEEAPRSLRSFTARSDHMSQQDSIAAETERGNEAVRSLRSFTVRSHHSDSSNETNTTDNGENPRSQGTLRSESPASLVPGTNDVEEHPRSMRSVSVYRN